MFDLPRSALLTAWARAVLRGTAAPDRAVTAVTGDDDPHLVEAEGESVGLVGLWAFLARRDVEELRLVLPVAGDPRGLPGPAAFNQAALEAGEAVLAIGPTGAWGIVPQIAGYGSAYEPGHVVTWRVRSVSLPRTIDLGSVGEAELLLRTALRDATDELGRLDLSTWSDDAAGRVQAVREASLPDGALPPGLAPRAVRVVSMALRVRAIVELAGSDDGGSVTLHEADTRRRTLLDLKGVCRRALVAAVNEPMGA